MAAETIVEIYRTQENKELFQFCSAVTITYFGKRAMLQGLTGRFTSTCWKELATHLRSKGIVAVDYYRRGKLKTVLL
ncbi:MAG TPA: hypothetical protein DF774_02145 [Rheinheimera sp.]|uniref:hypothetical protein n=1 Tax=Rheinheimera sp. TaxID=1869214 RepID=UPI000EC7C752|nr:hypothetical protein [Rheinheimera sp.]HCU64541.1 hypothetical protein [Rheinheimera sp.]